MHALTVISIKVYTKFKMPSFTHSKDMSGAQKLKMGYGPLPRIFHCSLSSLTSYWCIQPIYQSWSLYLHPLQMQRKM